VERGEVAASEGEGEESGRAEGAGEGGKGDEGVATDGGESRGDEDCEGELGEVFGGPAGGPVGFTGMVGGLVAGGGVLPGVEAEAVEGAEGGEE
jgi:hypothetical protein